MECDVLIIGSGPAGVQAALEALKNGREVLLLDIGLREKGFHVPDRSFQELRKTDIKQRDYFLGPDPARALEIQLRAGAHLTPPRQYMIRDSENIFPTDLKDFFALLATGEGGLGTSWGLNCFTFNEGELAAAGMNAAEMAPFYRAVSEDVGVSLDSSDDTSTEFFNTEGALRPLEIDDNCRSILDRYKRRRSTHLRNGRRLGKSALALLSQDYDGRRACRYQDMDFWANHGDSAWRPEVALKRLGTNGKFRRLAGVRAESFRETGGQIILSARSISDGSTLEIKAKRLIIACGAINSARLVLNSLPKSKVELPLLCNRNIWLASLNWATLGKSVGDARYSMSQLTAQLKMTDGISKSIAHFYSYRSLLLFRLLSRLPLAPQQGILFLRLIQNSLTLVNVHFPDAHLANRRRLLLAEDFRLKIVSNGTLTDFTHQLENRHVKKHLLALGVIPLSTEVPMDGASIHYAGTLSKASPSIETQVDKSGRLGAHQNVFVADSSGWNDLPAKGLTFTLMANARRITKNACRN